MKNFHVACTGIILFLISTGTFAQNFYLDLYGGYGAPLSSQTVKVLDGTFQTQEKTVKGDFGKGMNFGAGFGLKMTNLIGLEIGVSYFNSATIKAHDEYYEDYSAGYDHVDEFEFSSSIFRITPALRFSTNHEHLNAYTRIGCVIGVNGYYEEKLRAEKHNNGPMSYTELFEITQEYKGRMSAGFSGSVGLIYNLCHNFSIFIEGNGIAHSWAPKKGEITEFKQDGIDRMSWLSVSEREVEFVNEITESEYPDQDKPRQSLKMYVPLSAIFLNVGIQFRFGCTSNKKDTPAPEKN